MWWLKFFFPVARWRLPKKVNFGPCMLLGYSVSTEAMQLTCAFPAWALCKLRVCFWEEIKDRYYCTDIPSVCHLHVGLIFRPFWYGKHSSCANSAATLAETPPLMLSLCFYSISYKISSRWVTWKLMILSNSTIGGILKSKTKNWKENKHKIKIKVIPLK